MCALHAHRKRNIRAQDETLARQYERVYKRHDEYTQHKNRNTIKKEKEKCKKKRKDEEERGTYLRGKNYSKTGNETTLLSKKYRAKKVHRGGALWALTFFSFFFSPPPLFYMYILLNSTLSSRRFLPFLRDFIKFSHLARRRYVDRPLIVDCGVYDFKKFGRYPYTIASHYATVASFSDPAVTFVVPDYPQDMLDLGDHNIYMTSVIHDSYMSLNRPLIFTVQFAFENTRSFMDQYTVLMNKIYTSPVRFPENTLIGLGNLCLSKNTRWQHEFCRTVALDPAYTYHIFAPNLRFIRIMAQHGWFRKYRIQIDTSKYTRPCNEKRIRELLAAKKIILPARFSRVGLCSAPKEWMATYLEVYLERIQEILSTTPRLITLPSFFRR